METNTALAALKITPAQPDQETTHILIYTDGACINNPGPGGWSASIRRLEGTTETKKMIITGGEYDTTNNRMEMMAAVKALGCIRKDEAAPITIRSDSQLLIKGMNEWLLGWIAKGWKGSNGKLPKNRDLWEALMNASEGRKIIWEWVRGHADDALNNEVDGLAEAEARKFAMR